MYWERTKSGRLFRKLINGSLDKTVVIAVTKGRRGRFEAVGSE